MIEFKGQKLNEFDLEQFNSVKEELETFIWKLNGIIKQDNLSVDQRLGYLVDTTKGLLEDIKDVHLCYDDRLERWQVEKGLIKQEWSEEYQDNITTHVLDQSTGVWIEKKDD